MARTFTFKKIKPAVTDPNVVIMDKNGGTLDTDAESAQVEYEFYKPGQPLGGGGGASLSLAIDGQYFTEPDLDELINFLIAARQRVIKLNNKNRD